MGLQATKLSPRAPIFAQCVWKRAKNPRGARRRQPTLRLAAQWRASVGLAPRKPRARLNAILNRDGNAPLPTHKYSLNTCEIDAVEHARSQRSGAPMNQPRLINVAE